MVQDRKYSPILINSPLALLLWLLFRPNALERYLHSIHDRLDVIVQGVGKREGACCPAQ